MRKTERLTVRTSIEEKQRITAYAVKIGLSLDELIYNLIQDYELKIEHDIKVVLERNNELEYIVNNCVQEGYRTAKEFNLAFKDVLQEME
jgi:hypothetical protein